jgi:8-oxo-dGTP diphosphatase
MATMEIIKVCEALILNNKEQILLQLRDNKPEIHGPGKWGVIGGEKELHEEAIDCLKREVREEVGLEIEPVLTATVDDNDGNKVYRHYIYIAYYNNFAENLFLKEGQKIKFFNLSEIARLNKVSWFDRVYSPVIKKLKL